MDNHYINNKNTNSKYINHTNNNQSNIVHKYYSYNVPSTRINTDININNSSSNKYQINNNTNKDNNLLKRQFNQKELKENLKTEYNKTNYSKDNKDNMVNGNKRINHKIFVRVASKNKQENNNDKNTNLNNNKKLSSFTYNSNRDNNYPQKTNNVKSYTPLINYKSYQDSKSKIIPQRKSSVSNNLNSRITVQSKASDNSLRSRKNISNNNTQNISYRNYNKYNSTNKQIPNEFKQKKENEEKQEEENLMNIINKQVGINNLGNSCFINSSLQIFIHCPLFINKLISKRNQINENIPITFNFFTICETILKTKSKYISIYSFKNILGLKHKSFSGFIQQDSQEFIRLFLEDISKELNEIKNNTNIYRLLSNSDSKSKKMRDQDFHLNFSRREKSIITDIFYAQIVNIYTCQCKNEIYSFQKILDFPLLFPNKLKSYFISLYDLLKLYFSVEYIDFETKCDKCQKILKHKKELKISRPPEILILSLQRIDLLTGKKLMYKVKFPQKLDIKEFIDKECGYEHESKYDLFGIINHKGSLNSGHYFSYIENENKQWIEYNDSKVCEVKNFSDCTDSVYALFYIKEKYNNEKFFKI